MTIRPKPRPISIPLPIPTAPSYPLSTLSIILGHPRRTIRRNIDRGRWRGWSIVGDVNERLMSHEAVVSLIETGQARGTRAVDWLWEIGAVRQDGGRERCITMRR